jgi:hypothetical protein
MKEGCDFKAAVAARLHAAVCHLPGNMADTRVQANSIGRLDAYAALKIPHDAVAAEAADEAAHFEDAERGEDVLDG